MHFEWRRLRAGELDHELTWLAVTIVSAVWLATWLAFRLPLPGCIFHSVFGIPCLTCGSTRAAFAFLHGDIFSAWRFNPLATLCYIAIAIYDAYALFVLVRRGPRLRIVWSHSLRRSFATLIFGAALLNWVYLLRHI